MNNQELFDLISKHLVMFYLLLFFFFYTRESTIKNERDSLKKCREDKQFGLDHTVLKLRCCFVIDSTINQFTDSKMHPFLRALQVHVKCYGLLMKKYSMQIDHYVFGEVKSLEYINHKIGKEEVMNLLYQLGEVLENLRKKGLSHYDLKPNNIFIKRKRNGDSELVLGDFGKCRSHQTLSKLQKKTDTEPREYKNLVSYNFAYINVCLLMLLTKDELEGLVFSSSIYQGTDVAFKSNEAKLQFLKIIERKENECCYN